MKLLLVILRTFGALACAGEEEVAPFQPLEPSPISSLSSSGPAAEVPLPEQLVGDWDEHGRGHLGTSKRGTAVYIGLTADPETKRILIRPAGSHAGELLFSFIEPGGKELWRSYGAEIEDDWSEMRFPTSALNVLQEEGAYCLGGLIEYAERVNGLDLRVRSDWGTQRFSQSEAGALFQAALAN